MAETGWTAADFLASVRADAPSPGVLARMAAERQERADAQAEAERAARLEDERERRLIQYQQLGIVGRSAAEMFEAASRAADEDDRVAEARKTIERAERRREADAQAQRSQNEMLEQLAQRSRPRDGVEAASLRAREALESAVRRDDVLRRARAAQGPRPFSRRGGLAVRGEAPEGCSRAKFDANGFCGCLSCFEFMEQAQRSRRAREGVVPRFPQVNGSCSHGYIPSSCAECRAVSYR
jgi:hypothetical protein